RAVVADLLRAVVADLPRAVVADLPRAAVADLPRAAVEAPGLQVCLALASPQGSARTLASAVVGPVPRSRAIRSKTGRADRAAGSPAEAAMAREPTARL